MKYKCFTQFLFLTLSCYQHSKTQLLKREEYGFLQILLIFFLSQFNILILLTYNILLECNTVFV